MIKRVERDPLFVSDKRTLVTSTVAYTATVDAMYSSSLWPTLAEAIADARLACAEARLRQGQRQEALATYKAIADAAASGTDQAAKLVRLAATRGMLACLDAPASS